jgi:hypothetical protein
LVDGVTEVERNFALQVGLQASDHRS